MNNLPYLIALHSVNGLGPIRLKLLLDFYKDPKLAWEASRHELSELGLPRNALKNLLETRSTLDPHKYSEETFKSGIKVITVFDENYPKLLKQIYDPPIILYYVGEVPNFRRSLGVVGTRKITGYGKTVTDKFTKELVDAGFLIVSGLAKGVDTQAHRSTLEANGQTIAVLGGGLKKLFPAENKELAKAIAQGFGAVISESPPDADPLPGNFPARNRIIAGLSLGVLITEADVNSGSLITARLALDEGRDVFAVPGPITSSLSSGTSQLIKQGAKLVTSVEDILESLGLDKSVIPGSPSTSLGVNSTTSESKSAKIANVDSGPACRQARQAGMTEMERLVLNSLENESKHVDELCRELKKPSPEISATLIKLEIMGSVKSLGGGVYMRSI